MNESVVSRVGGKTLKFNVCCCYQNPCPTQSTMKIEKWPLPQHFFQSIFFARNILVAASAVNLQHLQLIAGGVLQALRAHQYHGYAVLL